MAQIAFLHVGADVTCPSILVRSIRAQDPDAKIVQCSDPTSPAIAGVSEVLRFTPEASYLMTFRLLCFSQVTVSEPTIFLDTDMICVHRLDPTEMLGENDVAVCRRQFGLGNPINAGFIGTDLEFEGKDFAEYAGKTYGQIYPYVACTTVTRDGGFWAACLADLLQLDRKFHFWFGDQEAIRNIVDSKKYRVGFLLETIYGCLPEMPRRGRARLLHFKGRRRKEFMVDEAKKMGLL